MARTPPTLVEVARVGRPHGLGGEVTVDLVTDRTERLAPGSVLVVGDGPATVEVLAARRHQRRWLVRLAGVDDRDGAEALRGAVLRAEPLDDPEALWVHDLVGAEVVERGPDGERPRGRVVAVQANPASDLLVLDSGALVPVRFVVHHVAGERIEVEVPEGLFDLGS